MKISIFPPHAIYELGRRDNQEDALFPALGEATTDDRVFVLCDGMGGHEHGEVASQTVVETVSRHITDHWPADDRVDDTLITDAIDAAFQALDTKDTGDAKKMGTTLTLVVLHAGGCTAAHIGDSRIYHIRPSEHRVLYRSRDHSLVFDLYQAGEISYDEMATSPQKNIITRSMQPGEDHRCRPDIAHIGNLQPGDYLYLCSDGMVERMDDAELVDLLSRDISDEKKCDKLRKATVHNDDNHTALLLRVRQVTREEGEAVADDEATTRCNALNVKPRNANRTADTSQPAPMASPRRRWKWLWLLLAALAITVAVACTFLCHNCSGAQQEEPVGMKPITR